MTTRDKLWALSLISRFLKDNGLEHTLESLKIETEEDMNELENAILPSDKTLLGILDDMKFLIMKQNMDKVTLERQLHAELMKPGNGVFPQKISRKFSEIHFANIISVLSCSVPRHQLLSHQDNDDDAYQNKMEIEDDHPETVHVIITGSTDKTIKVVDAQTGNWLNTLVHHSGPILCIVQHPKYKNILVTGGMEGKHYLVNLSTCEVIQTFLDHGKYVVKAMFSTWDEGRFLVTASFDKTVNIYELKEDSKTQNSTDPHDLKLQYVLVHTMTFRGSIESLCFVPASNLEKQPSLVIGVREDNYLHYIEMHRASGFPYTFYNMNTNGDDWVSFTPMDLSVSPSGNYLICYTDASSGRLIVFRTYSDEQVLNLYGPLNDEFAQPRCTWDASGKYIYATSGDNQIWVFEVSTGQVVTKLKGHKSMIRSLCYDYQRNVLVSCSYDKSVIVWE